MSEQSETNSTGGVRGRVFAYCHDSVGIGHLSRTLAICKRLSEEDPATTFLIATGTPYIPLFEELPRVDYIKLPSLTKIDNRTYQGKYLSIESGPLMRYRESLLLATVQHFQPELVLIDKAPLGVRRELVPSLQWIREHRPDTRVVFGMRDIEDEPKSTIEQWASDGVPEILEELFDEIWVYGMQDVFDVTREYQLSPRVCEKLHYLGYVAQEPCQRTHEKTSNAGGVLVTVGGGTDGEQLLRTYLQNAVRRVAKMGLTSTIVGGPDLPKPVAASLRKLTSGVANAEWIDFEPCMDCRIRDARVVVSMGGYNTLCLITRNRKAALVCPRVKPRLEQSMRAQLWSQRGAVEVMELADMSHAALAARVVGLVDAGLDKTDADLDLNGLDRVCQRFRDGRHAEESHATALPI